MKKKILTEYQFQLLDKIKDGGYLYENHKRLEGLTTVLVELLSKDTELLYSIIDGYFGDERVINAITDYLNTQPQAGVFTEFSEKNISNDIPMGFVEIGGELHKFKDTPEERKSVCDKHHKEICEECMRNGSWTFEDTPEEINPYEKITKEYARAFAKDEEKEDIKRLREEVEDTPEEWRELFAEWGLWSLVEDISDDGDGEGDNLQLTKEGKEASRMIEQLLDERECRAREEGREEAEDLYTKGHKKWKATIQPATKDIGNMKPYTN